MTSGVFHSVPVSSITIVAQERQRKVRSSDHIASLANSIRELGLIHPIVITRDHILVAGECRLQAVTSLGWTSIPAQYQDEIADWVLYGIELEENIKREDLDWRDRTRAIVRYHELRCERDPMWSQSKTAEAIGLSQPAIQSHLKVAANLSDPAVAGATTFETARNTARRLEERKKADEHDTHNAVIHTTPIEIDDFNAWAPVYRGPKFNLIHCDFPYGINAHESAGQNSSLSVNYEDSVETYWTLFKTLSTELDKFCTESAHMVFWFSPNLYCPTWEFLKLLNGFRFDEHPLIWQRGENEGIAPDPARRPRRVYEMAFFGWRGDRKIIRTKANIVMAPSERSRHPHEKSEAALTHFFEMCVDGNTRLFDPTCGSGSALRAARALGAKDVLGLELNEEYANVARRALQQNGANTI